MPERRRGSVSAAGEHQWAAFAKGEDFEIRGRSGKAEEGEKESVDFGVLDLKGLPAYAWVLKFIVRDESFVRLVKSRVTDLERE
ncbi:hypothetical protein N665_0280s0039 [Sinapis alba]|nr:hypothetical protein N665_0280s0039 [Sinapis alba]